MAVTPSIAAGPVVVRLLVPVGAAAVLLAAGHLVPLPVFTLLVGVVLAMVQPATIGAWVALPAAVWSFVADTDSHVGDGRILLAAAGLYLIHTATAASAAIPLSARLEAAVVARWAVRCVPAVVLTAGFAAIDAGLGASPATTLFAVVTGALVAVAAGVLVRRLKPARGTDRTFGAGV